MPSYTLPSDESARLAALYAMAVLDTPPEEQFDRLTRLAAQLFNVPIATVSLIDADRQWLKSRFGVDEPEMPRNISICTHTILGTQPLIIEDLAADNRFIDNPIVHDGPKIRFYAGIPLPSIGGHNVGSFCLIDTAPRHLSEQGAEALKDLANIARDLLRLRETSQQHAKLYAAAKAQEQVFQESFDLAGLGVMHVQAADGRVLHSNRRAREILGLAADATPTLAELPIQDRAGLDQRLTALTDGGPGPVRLEVPYDHPDLGQRWLAWTIARHAAGPLGAILVIIIDDASDRPRRPAQWHTEIDPAEALDLQRQITLRAERDQQAAEKKLRIVTEALPVLIGYWDREEKYRFANSQYLDWFGIPPERIIGLPLRLVIGDAAYFASQHHIRAALAGERRIFERTLARPDGSLRHTRTHYTPHEEEGKVLGVCVLVEDMGAAE